MKAVTEDLLSKLQQLDQDDLFGLLNALERVGHMKIMIVTRRDLEDALNSKTLTEGSGSWKMTDEQWEQFQQTYLWRKGIEESVDYSFLYNWARDEWSDLGFAWPDDEVTA